MGEAFLDYAKELFRQGKLQQAYDIAHLVSFNDCNCPGVRPLLAIYSVLLNGTTSDLLRVNCYKVLNVSSSASTDEITHRFATLKKLIAQARSPYTVVDRFSTAAAAEEANSLLNFAFQVLSDEKSRSRFDASWNIRPAGADNKKKPQALPPTPPLPEKKKPPQPLPPKPPQLLPPKPPQSLPPKRPQPLPPKPPQSLPPKRPQPLPPKPPLRPPPPQPLAEKKKPELIPPPPIAERKKPRVLPPLPRPLAEKRKRELTVPPPPPLAEKKKPQVVLPPPPAPVGGKRKREIIPCPTESKKRQSESEKPTIFKRIRVVRSDETWEGYSKLTKSNDCRSSANTAAAC
ncbi:Filamentous hemagglutinin [Linum perenne]